MRGTEAMRREEAPRALSVGTIVYRLTLQWGPRDLPDCFLRKPTKRAYPLCKEEYRERNLYADQSTAAIISILLGVVEGRDNTTKRYWFPPIELAEKYLTPNGEWDRVSEQWFQERLDLVNRFATPNAKPLTWGKWVKVLKKRVRHRVASRSRIQPTEEDIVAYREELIKQGGRDWSFVKLSDIKVSVVRGQGISLNALA